MILGWSEGFHDAAVAVLDGPDIVFASHSERFSGNKHEKYISNQLRDYVDARFGEEIDQYAFFEKPLLKKSRQLYAGQYKTVFTPRQLAWKPTSTFHHHKSHAAAAFQTSDLSEASAVVVDSIGEWTTTSIWKCYYKNGRAVYEQKHNVNYPQSIGLWYTALTQWCGLRPLDEEYIFMGMAAFGEENVTLQSALRELFKFNLHRGIPRDFADNYWLYDYKHEDIAAAAQVVLEEKLSKIFFKAKMYSDNIVYGGGVALNCVANSKLHRMVPGKFWIMPNPGDAGGSLGAAALAYGGPLNWTDPYLGYRINGYDEKEMVNDIVNHLMKHKICGVANGPAEFGPRALGNRSLLADPRGNDIKDLVNTVKKRQKFRPFAPCVLEEHAEKYFEGPYGEYMQFVSQAKPRWHKKLPAILHVDNSCRVQTVGKKEDTILRKVLELWYKKTKCPVLLNTSLNIRGEPMVNSPNDAVRFEKKYKIKVFS